MASSDDAKTKTPVIVALDWTPNGNHLGFYVALDAGVYADAGLDVRLVSPSDADYKGSYTPSDDATASDAAATATPYVTPCSKVAAGDAHFAINSPEGVLGWNTADGRPRLKAVAALLHDRNTSAIVTLRSSGKASPADLDGATYASYAARFEGRIVREIIRHAGGKGDFREVTPPMLGVFETLVKGDADATWIFKQWEGVEAVLEGIDLNVFTLLDNGVPYAYNPCLCAHPEWLRANAATARAFLEATAEGYRRAADDPGAAADALLRRGPLSLSLSLSLSLGRLSLRPFTPRFRSRRLATPSDAPPNAARPDVASRGK